MVKTALFLAPHTDDVELGCGATLARYSEEGVDVYAAAFYCGRSTEQQTETNTLQREYESAMNLLGIKSQNLYRYHYPARCFDRHRQEILESMRELKRCLQADIVFVPSSYDFHQDHQVICREALRVWKDTSIWGYELPWNHTVFHAQAFTVLQERHVQAKWEALQEYHSQFKLGRPYFDEDIIRSLARMRGIQCGARWAEAFEVIRCKYS